MKLPVRQVNKLYHWGTMNPDNVGKNGPSQEGNCLSASLCPEAWLTLARLGAEQLYSLSRDGGAFFDIGEVLHNKRLEKTRSSLLLMAISGGFVEEKTLFEVNFYADDELIGKCLYSNLDEALVEADYEEENIKQVDGYACTEKLMSFIGIGDNLRNFGSEYGIIGVVKKMSQEGLGVDGIYFGDEYDPSAFSAPRFGIFPDKVSSWSFALADRDLPRDVDLMMTLGKIKGMDIYETPKEISSLSI